MASGKEIDGYQKVIIHWEPKHAWRAIKVRVSVYLSSKPQCVMMKWD